MDGFYGQSMSPNDYKELRSEARGSDAGAGSIDVSMPDTQNYSEPRVRQSMSDPSPSVQSGAGNDSRGATSSAGHDGSQTTDQAQQYARMLSNNLNAFQFNPQAGSSPNFIGHVETSNDPPGRNNPQSHPQSPSLSQQQQQNNLMSQLMFQNAYANMLQNQQLAMRMNPGLADQLNMDLSDPNVLAMVKNNLASLNLMSQQNQMMQNMGFVPGMQNAQQQSNQTSAGGNINNDSIASTGALFNQLSPLHTMGMNNNAPGSYSLRNSPVTNTSRHGSIQQVPQSQDSLSQSRAHDTVYNPQQTEAAQQLFMQQPGSEDMAQPAFGVGQGDVTGTDLGNANPFPSAVKLNQNSYRDAYSSTGFDMLKVLMRVATRPDPQINIGAVDLSCAFVVCDVRQHDVPIVYCSDNFERLTGYTKHEILGRNCRFLQAPSGHVSAGVKRKYSDDDTILHLKNTINARQEAQVSLINYRKGGQPFMNLLTMIPVSYDEGDDAVFYVGFQVDLVEQPHSVTSKNSDGTYTVNYQRGLTMPRYVFSDKDQSSSQGNSGHTISRDEVSTVLATVGSGDSELSKRIWDKVLLENTDDVVFVLSLKGLFLYLSPSSSRILEYDPAELTSTALSSVCHPSDIVPVTRELKDSANGATVSVVFRIRRKDSGYMWFEGHGSLYTEQGKGRKSIVLVGRERPVYTLKQTDIQASGGIGDNEVWTKLSTSGMFLFVSSSIRALIDKQPHELIGTSIQSLMRPDSRAEFGRILEIARSGRRAQTRHELLNRRGQVLQAFSTLYPGDAQEGSKPTFFVAQTRLLKYIRPNAAASNPTRSSTGTSQPPDPTLVTPTNTGSAEASRQKTSTSRSASSRGSPNTPQHYMSTFETISTHAGQDSLPLGDQGEALASEFNMFDELKTTRSTSWQYELRQMERHNRLLAEELQRLLAARKKRKRRKGAGVLEKECANCHTKQTPEWRRGPSGNRDLCNSCGLRWAKQQGRISPRTSGQRSSKSAKSAKSAGSRSEQSPEHAASQQRNSASAGSGGEARSIGSIDETLAQGKTPTTTINAASGASGATPAKTETDG